MPEWIGREAAEERLAATEAEVEQSRRLLQRVRDMHDYDLGEPPECEQCIELAPCSTARVIDESGLLR